MTPGTVQSKAKRPTSCLMSSRVSVHCLWPSSPSEQASQHVNTLRCRLCSGQFPRANSLSSPVSKTNTLGSHPILRRYGLKMALHQTFMAPCCLQNNAQNTKFLSWAYSSGCPDPSPPSQQSSITTGSFLSLGTPDWPSCPISSFLGKITSILFLFLCPSHIMCSE